jgi:hypothetical protein
VLEVTERKSGAGEAAAKPDGTVTTAPAGVQNALKILDSGLRRNDVIGVLQPSQLWFPFTEQEEDADAIEQDVAAGPFGPFCGWVSGR